MRRLIAFDCAGDRLVATLDEGSDTTALLIVSGGNEVRSGAHRGMALLAQALATSGVPVLRFDRRGVGDSGGENRGYAESGPDIAAAAALLRREQPQVARLVGFGNCDAAAALALFGRPAGIDSLILANPWTVAADSLPPSAAIRARYRERLRDPAAWARLLRGGIDLRLAARGLAKLVRPEPPGLTDMVIAAIRDWGDDARVMLAQGDATAITFADAAARRGLSVRTDRIATASHSFAGAGDALEAAIRAAL